MNVWRTVGFQERKVVLNCRESTRLLSEAQERELNVKERVALRFHTLICSSCRRFGRHMDIIRKAARRFTQLENEDK